MLTTLRFSGHNMDFYQVHYQPGTICFASNHEKFKTSYLKSNIKKKLFENFRFYSFFRLHWFFKSVMKKLFQIKFELKYREQLVYPFRCITFDVCYWTVLKMWNCNEKPHLNNTRSYATHNRNKSKSLDDHN